MGTVPDMPATMGDAQLAARLREGLAVPVIAAPMFLVSGPDLVIACRREGVIGSFPTINARTPAILDEWLGQIAAATTDSRIPFAANLIVHSTNERLEEDLAIVYRHRAPMVISSVGSPAKVVAAVHAYGGIVLADVATLKHARRCLEAGVDGLILLCAGAGGNTGWINPFAFLAEVRRIFAGPVVVAGGITAGRQIRALELLGADFAYVGTRFIATRESMASDGYRDMLVSSTADDILLTDRVTGIPANMLRPSIEQAGFDLNHKHEGSSGFSLMKELTTLRAWRDVWSAGHGVGGVDRVTSVADLVEELRAGYL